MNCLLNQSNPKSPTGLEFQTLTYLLIITLMGLPGVSCFLSMDVRADVFIVPWILLETLQNGKESID